MVLNNGQLFLWITVGNILIVSSQMVVNPEYVNTYCDVAEGTGHLSSPGFPDVYEHYLDVCWMLFAEENSEVQITFHTLDLEEAFHCPYDRVNLFNSYMMSPGSEDCRLCGTIQEPYTYTSTGGILVVQLISDGSITAPGFEASWVSVPADPNGPAVVQECLLTMEVYPELVNLTEIAIEPIIDPIPDINITLPVLELEMFPQIPTSADCSHERVEAVIANILERLRLAAPFAWSSLVHHSYIIGVDLGEDDGIHQLACYVASISNIEELSVLLPGIPIAGLNHVYYQYIQTIQIIDTGELRLFLASSNRLLDWMKRTTFPNVPLLDTTYSDTWQFMTELQRDTPEPVIHALNALHGNMGGTFSPAPTVLPLMEFFLETPEKLARVLHNADHPRDIEPVLDLFSGEGQVYRRLIEEMSQMPASMYVDIQELYVPVTIATLELYDILVQKGWTEF